MSMMIMNKRIDEKPRVDTRVHGSTGIGEHIDTLC